MPTRIDSNLSATNMLRGTKLGLDVAMGNLATIDEDVPAQRVVSNVLKNGQVEYKTADIVNESVLNHARNSLLDFAQNSVKLNALKSIEETFGKQGDENSFVHLGSNISESFHLLATSTKEDFANSKAKTFNAIQNFLQSAQNFSSKLQDVRSEAEVNITNSLDEINACLQKIADYNLLAMSKNTDNQTATSEQRNGLNKLAKNIGFYSKEQQDGTLKVYSDQSGRYLLVDKGQSSTFTYTPTNDIDTSTTFNPITVSHAGQTYAAPSAQDGNDFTNYLTSLKGPLSSNLNIRNTIAPSLQEQINKVGAYMFTNFNEFHNQGVSTALRSTIKGEGILGASSILGTESLDSTQMTGNIRFALMKSDLKLATPPLNGKTSLNIDLSEFNTYLTDNTIQTSSVNDFVNFLNQQFTTNGVGITASVTNHQFTLTASDSSLGIVMGDVNPTSLQIVSENSSAPFSEFFGLNNLFSTTVNLSDPDFINKINIRPDIALNRGDALSVGQLITDQALSQTSSVIFGTAIAESISDSFKNDVLSFSETATLGQRQMTLQDYLKTVVTNHESMISTTEDNNNLLKATYERANKRVTETSKLSREEIQNQLYEFAFFQKYVVNILQVSYSMMDAITELGRR